MFYFQPQKAIFVFLTFQFVDLQVIADPCPDLQANHLGRKLFEAPDGHHCCGCEFDYYVVTVCSRDNVESTVCTKCPEGTGIAENAHGKGKEYCKIYNSTATPELPIIRPTSVPNVVTETLPQDVSTFTNDTTTTTTTTTSVPSNTTTKKDINETKLEFLGVGIVVGIPIGILAMVLIFVFCKHKDVKWRRLWKFFRTSNNNLVTNVNGGNAEEQGPLLNGAMRNDDMELQEMNRQQPQLRNNSQPNVNALGQHHEQHAFNDSSRSGTPKPGCSRLNQRNDEFVQMPEDNVSRGRSSTRGSGIGQPHSSENTPQTNKQIEPGCSSGNTSLNKTPFPTEMGILPPDGSPIVGVNPKTGHAFMQVPHGINHRVAGSAESTPKVSRNQPSSYTERRSTMPQEQAAKVVPPKFNTKQSMSLPQDCHLMPHLLQLNQGKNGSVPCLSQDKGDHTPRAATPLKEKLNKIQGDSTSSSRRPSPHPYGQEMELSSDLKRTLLNTTWPQQNGTSATNDGASTSGLPASGFHNIASETAVKKPIGSHNGSRSSTPHSHCHLPNAQASCTERDSHFPSENQNHKTNPPTNTARLNGLQSAMNRNKEDAFIHPDKVNMNEGYTKPLELNGVEQAHRSNMQDCNLQTSDDDEISKMKAFFSGIQNKNRGISLDLDNAKECARNHGIGEIDITTICQGNVKEAFVKIIINLHNRDGQSFTARKFIEYFRDKNQTLLAEELDKDLGFGTSPSKKSGEDDEAKL